MGILTFHNMWNWRSDPSHLGLKEKRGPSWHQGYRLITKSAYAGVLWFKSTHSCVNSRSHLHFHQGPPESFQNFLRCMLRTYVRIRTICPSLMALTFPPSLFVLWECLSTGSWPMSYQRYCFQFAVHPSPDLAALQWSQSSPWSVATPHVLIICFCVTSHPKT